MNDIYDSLASYGVRFEGEQGAYQPADVRMTLSELASSKGTIVRVRWIGGDYIPGRGRCYDLSYVQGQLPDGRRVSLDQLPASFLIPRHQLKKAMIEWAKEEGVFGKGMGLLDDGNYSILG
jgi:hypothetical protein